MPFWVYAWLVIFLALALGLGLAWLLWHYRLRLRVQAKTSALVQAQAQALSQLTQAKQVSDHALARLQKLNSRVPGMVYQFLLRPDGSGCIPFVSDAIRDIYRLSPQQVQDDAACVFALIHPQDLAAVHASILESARLLTPWQCEYRVKFEDGTVRWLFGNALPERMDDGAVLWHGFVTDITERQQVDVALQTSLKEKVALLNEVHHRVKNNLQVINSLLHLQARRSAQPDTKTALTDMQGRIQAMALLHETLYRSGIFASVDLGHYLKQLASQAIRAQSLGAVRLHLALDTLRVSMDLATPCGLLVNELITNCLKHAFPAGRTGEIHMALHPLASPGGTAPTWCLSVCDTGVGLPADFEARRSQSLGLQLAADLAQQLGGTLSISASTVPGSDSGACFTVRFSVGFNASFPVNFAVTHPR